MKQRVWKKRLARARRLLHGAYVWYRGWNGRVAFEGRVGAQDHRYVRYRGKKIFLYSARIPGSLEEALEYIHENDNELRRLEQKAKPRSIAAQHVKVTEQQDKITITAEFSTS